MSNLRKKSFWLFCILAVAFTPMYGEVLQQDGLDIVLTKKPVSEAPGYSVFLVTVVNTTGQDRSFHGLIRLTWMDDVDPSAPPRATARCIVYMEVPAGHRLNERVSCRGSNYTRYDFEVESVYPFILPKTPLNWQKSEPVKPQIVDPEKKADA